jgi:thiol:disulfide interchange protein DsbA
MQRRMSGYLAAIALAVLAMALPARAEVVADRDYVAIVPAQVTDNPAKTEVLEFFSYGCPHCADFDPLVSKWAKALPSDVVFKRVPISFGRPQWASLARLYYALEASGELTKLDAAVFRALHQENKRLFDDKSIIAWVSAQGVDEAKFTARPTTPSGFSARPNVRIRWRTPTRSREFRLSPSTASISSPARSSRATGISWP